MPNNPRIPWSRYLPAAIIFGMGVGLSVVGFAGVWEWENRRRDYELNRGMDVLAARLQQQIDADLEIIRTITDFFKASKEVDRASFEQFVRRPLSNPSTVSVIAWVERVEDSDRETYEAQMAGSGEGNFMIAQSIAPGGVIRRDRFPEYFPISYIAPLLENPNTSGWDLAANPTYQAALKQAAQMGKMLITDLLDWQVVGAGASQGFLAVQPIYENTIPTGSILPPDSDIRSDDALPLRGFVVGWVEVVNLFQLAGAKDRQFNLYLCDETPGTGMSGNSGQPYPLLTLLESTELIASLSTPEPFAGDVPSQCPFKAIANQRTRAHSVVGMENESALRREIKVNERIWAFYIWPTEEYQASRKHWRSWAVLIIGFLWTHIPVTYLLTSVSRTAEIEALALARAEQSEQLQQAFKQLEVEQAKSERLLLNVLPKAIAERLKEDTQTIAESFPEVTVLFADIVGFTKLAARISPTELVQLLNQVFTIFDRLAEKHGLEKIKTIGDAYMVVGGLPVHSRNHAEAMAEMALDMQSEILHFNRKCQEPFLMRIGIHTGPAIAGVIGTHKFIYDLWGDTVNIASRMESHGVPGRIQVSSTTYSILESGYCFECRGPIPIKGKGEMLVYLLGGRKKEGICIPIVDDLPLEEEVAEMDLL